MKTRFFAFAALALTLAACNNDNENLNDGPVAAQFIADITPATRVNSEGTDWTDGDRIGLNITYALGWLRQEENQYLSCPPDIARDLDPELQQLLGYATGQYDLGYYTPPLPPGAGPELVAPEYALRPTGAGADAAGAHDDAGSVFGSHSSRDAVRAAIESAAAD